MTFIPRGGSPARWIVFIIGIIIFLWGMLAIVVSAGVPPLSIVTIQTPLGTVQTNDRQFAGGLLLAFFGLFAVWISSRV